eukprot:m.183477 g.183477  ORF g.183477 m.183477 type:complete len:58 (+) comp16652_c0_seq1:292-465(+)
MDAALPSLGCLYTVDICSSLRHAVDLCPPLRSKLAFSPPYTIFSNVVVLVLLSSQPS